jgi:hypothetical protein
VIRTLLNSTARVSECGYPPQKPHSEKQTYQAESRRVSRMLAGGSVVIRLRGLVEAYATSGKAKCEHYIHWIHFLIDRDMWLTPVVWFGYVLKGY